AAARWLVCCAVLGLVLAGCGGGAGGGSTGGSETPGGGEEKPLATRPVDLPPGQREAEIAWEPSRGNVSGYMIFLSRNGRFFQFHTTVSGPSTRVQGAPGEVVRILVAAIGADDQTSDVSPPSVPIRFHADPNAVPDDPAAADLPPVGGGNPDPTPNPTPDPTPPPADGPPSNPTPTDPTPPPADPDPTTPPNATPDASPDTPPVDATKLTTAMRTRLLTTGLQTSLTGLSAATRAWIAPWLSGEVATELAPLASAASASAGWRDLVWQDASGQLFVSEGPALAAAADPASTLVAGIPLLGTERFVALADLDGDGLRDWIVENVETGVVTLRSDANGDARSARAADQAETDRLIGLGDFDGDGRPELLWQAADAALFLARPEGLLPPLAAGTLPPAGYHILAIADWTGDGLDDLIARNADGLVAVGESTLPVIDPSADPAPTGGLALAWSEGLAEAGVTAELIATLDLEGDGRAELVWRTDAGVEIRGLGEALPRAF
ncbi:VCBS repeat-containing protein, partial [Myxococcota bacterium]|nr:VCBS repeat-containing protein [Myxococcota bacterium]